MTDMPERIWLDWPGAKHGEPIYTEPPERDTQAGQTEYVRADIVQALTAERDEMAMSCLSADGEAQRAWDAQKAAEAERDRLGREVNVAKYGQPDFAWSVHLAAMAELQAERDRQYDENAHRIAMQAKAEAERDRLREALQFYDDLGNNGGRA